MTNQPMMTTAAPRRPRVYRERSVAQLQQAEWLRPAEVARLYPIAARTLRRWCTEADRQVPHRKQGGYKGHKALITVPRGLFAQWWDWDAWRSTVPLEDLVTRASAEFTSFEAWLRRAGGAPVESSKLRVERPDTKGAA